jgi:uncharacterized protein
MEEWVGAIREEASGIEVRVRVVPRSSRQGCSGGSGGQVRFNLHAAPVEDAANRELIEVLAGGLKVSRGSVRIIRGGKSRDKVVRIDGANRKDFVKAFLKKD